MNHLREKMTKNTFLFIFIIVILSFLPIIGKEPIQTSKNIEPILVEDFLKLGTNIRKYAKKFIGVRYRRGGKTPKGFDCSGFVIHVYKKFGMNFGSSSQEMVRNGEKIDPKEALPGDLVFFRRGKNPKSSISHVGIVWDNTPKGLRFIHSATSKGVTISYLKDKYYAAHFASVHRIAKIDSASWNNGTLPKVGNFRQN